MPCRAILVHLRSLLCVAALWIPRIATAADDGDLSSRIILLANSKDPESLAIAEHYAELRKVPLANIIRLPMPRDEVVTWAEFTDTIWNPLLAKLVSARWLDAVPMQLTDEVGRRKYFVSGHRISYLVICRGVPSRVAHDPARLRPVLPMTKNPIFRINSASIDSELNLLALPNHEINAYISNPLFSTERPAAGDLAQVVKVSRLDGPSYEEVLRLPDRAIAAENSGLSGRAYVDLGGNHPDGDVWLKSAARQLLELGFETDVDSASTTIPATARFDEPVLYFGWYASSINGPFALPGFRFPIGAIALHIHSFSAATLRDPEKGWTGPFVARGVTATVGNVYEPYLQLTHRPDLLVRALARGDTFGDAVCYAQPALSWNTLAIGDPLYRPFAHAPVKRPAPSTQPVSAP